MAAGDDRPAAAGRAGRRRDGAPNRRGQPGDDVPLIAQAVVTAVNTFGSAIESLPPVEDPDFTPRVDDDPGRPASARGGRGEGGPDQQGDAAVDQGAERRAQPLRRTHDAAPRRAPGATLGQRLYAARRGANLTILETAQAAGVSEETSSAAEAEEPVPAAAVREIESLIEQLD